VSALSDGQVTGRIRTFLARHVRAEKMGDEDDIFAAGWVNSLFAMQLVLFLEKEFAIAIENQDLERANFRSVRAMADLVARKHAPGAEAPRGVTSSSGSGPLPPG